MSIDLIERRRAVEARLARARNLASTLDTAAAEVAAKHGMPIETLDPDGSLRTALQALAGVAALRPNFDVLVSLPDSTNALRVRHLDDNVDISLVQHSPTAGQPVADTAGAAGTDGDSGVRVSTGLMTDGDVVASDLAAMLWQDVGPPA